MRTVIDELAGEEQKPWREDLLNSIQSRFQKTVIEKVLAATGPHAEERIRHKQSRWKLQGFPGANARRVLRRLDALFNIYIYIYKYVAKSIFDGFAV